MYMDMGINTTGMVYTVVTDNYHSNQTSIIIIGSTTIHCTWEEGIATHLMLLVTMHAQTHTYIHVFLFTALLMARVVGIFVCVCAVYMLAFLS